jgi:hypothetical protein
MNHIATGRALSLGENYSLLIMGVSNGDGDGGAVDGDGSGGNSPSRQGAGTETSVPRNWSSMAAALWNFSWMDADLFRVFTSGAIYRRKGDVRGHLRGPHHMVARPEVGQRHPMVWPPPDSSLSPLWTPSSCQKNRNFRLRFIQFREYFMYNFSEIQKQQKAGTGTVASC